MLMINDNDNRHHVNCERLFWCALFIRAPSNSTAPEERLNLSGEMLKVVSRHAYKCVVKIY